MTKAAKTRLLRWAAAALLCAAALAARLWYPGLAERAETWFLGPEGNQVSQAFAVLENTMGEGVGVAVEAFCEEFSAYECT